MAVSCEIAAEYYRIRAHQAATYGFSCGLNERGVWYREGRGGGAVYGEHALSAMGQARGLVAWRRRMAKTRRR